MPNVCIAKIMYTNSIKNLLTFFQMYFLALHIRIWVRTYDVCKCQNKMWLLHLKVTNVAVNHHDYNISLKNVTNTYFPRVKYMHSTHYSTPMYSNFNWPKFFQQTKYQMMCIVPPSSMKYWCVNTKPTLVISFKLNQGPR